ncbi:class II aldolase/adducin family protein [Myxococcota bacterium]|nr:class II aldolase/adducin family protein [Myxococcota bacterium]MBU1430008.1 class II aldolase/adducin family protein [Myxococcota bacterium]MBU1899847.1 class II aldolase/adducin family protein [Myxococcota bacterium]
MSETRRRRQLVHYARRMDAKGWSANHDGNLSTRGGEGRLICTPTAFSKADIGLDDLLVVDLDGRKIAGPHRPFSEIALHTAIYGARPDVEAVVHAHPPTATAFGVSGRALPHPFLPEAVVSLGARVPTIPLTPPGAAAVEALRAEIRRCDGVLIAGNGVLSWGPSLELAFLRLELIEHLAQIAAAALPLGGPKALPPSMVEALVLKRHQAGLAAPEEPLPGRPLAPPSTPVERALDKVLAGLPNASPEWARRVAEQVVEGLKL